MAQSVWLACDMKNSAKQDFWSMLKCSYYNVAMSRELVAGAGLFLLTTWSGNSANVFVFSCPCNHLAIRFDRIESLNYNILYEIFCWVSERFSYREVLKNEDFERLFLGIHGATCYQEYPKYEIGAFWLFLLMVHVSKLSDPTYYLEVRGRYHYFWNSFKGKYWSAKNKSQLINLR
jgi:hypothetical protein